MDAVLHLFRLAANACGTNTGPFPSIWDSGRGLTCVKDATSGVVGPQITSAIGFVTILGNLTRIVIFMAGGVAVVMIIFGGIMWVISGGDPGRIKMGRDIITNAIIGLVITIAAYAVVTFLVGGFA